MQTFQRCSAVVVCLLFSACIRGEPGTAPRDCSSHLVLPGVPLRVMSMTAEGVVSEVPVRCAHVGCLRFRDEAAVAVVQPDGVVWAAWAGHPGAVLGADAQAETPDRMEAWARRQSRFAKPLMAKAAAAADAKENLPDVQLPPELRTCGTTQAGGGLGYHIIQNAGDIWQRIHWVKPPTAPEVLALSKDAYPIAGAGGVLCAWGTQSEPRNWQLHLVKSGKVITGRPDVEHAPARCLADGVVEVQTPDGALRISEDGKEVPSIWLEPGKSPRRLNGTGAAVIPGTAEELEIPTETDLWKVALASQGNADLSGNALEGATRMRLVGVGNGAGVFAVAERFQLEGCRVRESLHLLNAQGRTIRRVKEGALLHLRPGSVGGVFYWVEGPPRVVDINNDEAESGTVRF